MQRIVSILAALLLSSAALAGPITHVDNDQLKKLMNDGVPLVDVRTAGEWAQTGVVKGSHRLTFFDEQGNYDAEKFMTELSKIAKPGEPVAFICASGARTMAITQFLGGDGGYEKIHNVERGIMSWIHSGNSVVPVK